MSYIIDKLLLLFKMFASIFKRMFHSKRLKGSRPHTFPIVKTLPPGDAPIGTVINGTRDGPRFDLPEGSFSDLQNVGIFGPPRCGKNRIWP